MVNCFSQALQVPVVSNSIWTLFAGVKVWVEQACGDSDPFESSYVEDVYVGEVSLCQGARESVFEAERVCVVYAVVSESGCDDDGGSLWSHADGLEKEWVQHWVRLSRLERKRKKNNLLDLLPLICALRALLSQSENMCTQEAQTISIIFTEFFHFEQRT